MSTPEHELGPDDVRLAARACVDALSPLVDRDWTIPAGDLDWTALQTLDHIIDALGFCAAHLARRRTERLPFYTGSIVAKQDGQIPVPPASLLAGVEAMAAVLADVVTAAPPGARSVAYPGRPALYAADFASIGCTEMLVHTDDICRGFGMPFDPPALLCQKLIEHRSPWAVDMGVDPWTALRFVWGRIAIPPYGRLGPDGVPITPQQRALMGENFAHNLMGPWPLVTDLVRAELRAYLDAARSAEIEALPTRCSPWTVCDLTAHLGLTFRRFGDMLEQSRSGDLSPPFGPQELPARNLRNVEQFEGDPLAELAAQAERFLAAAVSSDELMAHQFGPIPVGLQVLFGLNELALHRHDLEEARGGSYRPDSRVIDALVPVWERVLRGLPPGEDPWQRILIASGRDDAYEAER